MRQALRDYNAVIPELRAMGLNARIIPARRHAGLTVYIAHRGEARVGHDGRWTRDNGHTGRTPDELVADMRAEILLELLDHHRDGDRNAIARDLLAADGAKAPVVTDVRPLRGRWRVTYRAADTSETTVTLHRPMERMRALIGAYANA